MTTVLERWNHTATAPSRELILPDGCRDLILVAAPGQRPDCFVSELQAAPRMAEIAAGARMTGFRLKPGTMVDAAPLLTRVAASGCDPEDASALLAEHTARPPVLAEAIHSLEAADSASVARAARRIGLGLRSLQRLFRDHDLPPPGFWLQLARARRAAAALAPQVPLSDLAADAGYADQAHMTRAFRRWFAISPARLQHDAGRRHLLRQSGLAVPLTGEQISIR
ncbi:AraC family transcriptional regulator [Stappia taiwanensis]|uniref:AraC family transcriptional regulator n=1 Tax=Stappia taiwanensis TaxID=992267 RepID=A0A838XWR7_9HYPH|nr:helix-turn-helix domain-containing protein [Stappia taiwanensis]MBA4611484.1 AraC family transcriptional regulator [Stappia taiwanensis]GGE99908.1 AraC family transcriptional regulator [Stappia taiwanensis]